MTFKVNIFSKVFFNDNHELCSIFEYINSYTNDLYKTREILNNSDNLDLEKLTSINEEIREYVVSNNIPFNCMFRLVEQINCDEVYVEEVFSGKLFVASLKDINSFRCKIFKANLDLFKYTNLEIDFIMNNLPRIDFNNKFEHMAKIIKFPKNI